MTGDDPMTVLVMAKAPVPGRVKTRLAVDIGDDRAAELAAAALLDTIAATQMSGGSGHLCLAGDLADAVRAEELAEALAGWTITPQRGNDFAQRLVNAHADAGDGLVAQIGMDTPQVTGQHLRAAANALSGNDAVLGRALDGGWWVLVRRDARVAEALAEVEMSTSSTCADTQRALTQAGHRVGLTAELLDVDTLDDARTVADLAPATLFAQAWRGIPLVTR